MHRFSIILTIAVVALGSALSLSIDYGLKKNTECQRLSSNQSTLLQTVETFRVRDSLNGASIRSLSMREGEFKAHFAAMNSLIRDMGIRVKHIENISQTSTQTQYRIETQIKDSTIIQHNSLGEVSQKIVQSMEYCDPHLSLHGVIEQGKFLGSIMCRDTLTQIAHRIPRKFLFFRWGTKELRQEIVSSNPHTQITYSRHIEIIN